MKIQMLVSTTYGGRFLKIGDLVEIDNEAGKRFVKNRIAIQLEEEKAEEAEADIGEVDEPEEKSEAEEMVEEVDINTLSNKELFNLCNEKEIELDKTKINGKTAKEKKEYLLLMLSGE